MADRPFIVLNMASTLDGKIGLPGKRPLKLSSEEDFARVHRLRAEAQAVVVGIETVLADDPKLTVKEEHVPDGSSPLRVVLDSAGRVPRGAAVLDGSTATLIVTAEDVSGTFPNAEALRCGTGEIDLLRLVGHLAERGVQRILVEGGGTVAWSFLRAGLVDRFHVYIAPWTIGDERAPSLLAGNRADSPGDMRRLRLREVTVLGEGLLVTYEPAQKGGGTEEGRGG
ncbi:MAG: RibD family protein [Candidatus Thermoplasmatota archaeon]|nr:RibD family protein [Candidatus Thermoplasmatota archaeon]